MMQSLAEVEPVALDASFECALGLSVRAEGRPFSVPAPDPRVAERFESAMADVAAGAPDVRRMVLAFDRIGETVADGAAPRRFGDKPSGPGAHVAGDFPDTAVPKNAGNPSVMDVRTVGYLPDAPVHTVAGDSPEMPVFKSGGPADAPVRTVAGDSPEMPAFKSSGPTEAPVHTVAGDSPEMPVFKSGGPADAPVRTVAGDSPEMPAFKSSGPTEAPVHTVAGDSPKMPTFKSSGPAEAPVRTAASNPPEMPAFKSGGPAKAPVRTVADDSLEMPTFKSGGPAEAPVRTAAGNPPGMSLRTVDGNSPGTAGHVVLDATGDMPVREVRVAKSTLPEQAQIIAPAPLPIEMPVATVLRQQPASPAPSDAVRTFVAAAEAVADAILVSSGFADGEGSVIVRLQPEVLGGSEVRIAAKDGTLTVVVNAATQDVQEMVEANRVRFEQHLSEKVHSWRISVAVRRGGKLDERI